MGNERAHETRLERILGVPLAEHARRQWPQSGEVLHGRERISEVESHFVGLRLGVGRRHRLGDRNVSVADLDDGKAVRVTDYWGEPFERPDWREKLSDSLEMPPDGTWPAAEALQGDEDEAP